jgi:hypothetical protein
VFSCAEELNMVVFSPFCFSVADIWIKERRVDISLSSF